MFIQNGDTLSPPHSRDANIQTKMKDAAFIQATIARQLVVHNGLQLKAT